MSNPLATVAASTSADISAAVAAAAHAMRMELVFGVCLALLWWTGRFGGARLSAAKQSPQQNGKRRSAPSQSRPVATARDRDAVAAGGDRRSAAQKLDPVVEQCLRERSRMSRITQSLLADHSWVLPQISLLCRQQVHSGLELYRAALDAGMKLQSIPSDECERFYMTILTATIRVGEAREALSLMRDLREKSSGVPMAVFYSATKLCTAKQLFAECLAIYKFMSEDALPKIDDKSVWSCLLFCAVEVKAFQQCKYFWDKLKETGSPSSKDYGNIVRFASIQGDWQLALAIVQEMRAADVEVDSVIYNTVLATCVTAEKTEQACSLLDDMERRGVTDVITYNTLAKGYARVGKLDRCFELHDRMRRGGVTPSQVTYGILLDVCINENQVDRAAEVADAMEREGCEMNTVLCTTLIKGFARAGQLDRAMKVYEQMCDGRGQAPDLITFSILIKANCDSQRLDVAFKLLEAMLEFGLRPDEVVFNNLLGGCCKESNAKLGQRLYGDMVAAGIRPSSATFSILIRLYSQCKMLEDAVEMIKTEPKARHVEPEARLFSQLLQCCLRERQGRRAVEVYQLMLEQAKPTAAIHSSVLSMCVKLNMLDTGAEILDLAAQAAKGSVDAADAQFLLAAAQRKKKTQVVDTCLVAMRTLGMAA